MQANRLRTFHYELFSATLINNVARIFGFALLTTLLIPLVGAGVTVRFSGEPSGEDGRHNTALAEQWAQKTGNKGPLGKAAARAT